MRRCQAPGCTAVLTGKQVRWCSGACKTRAVRARKARTSTRRKRSGLQVSYRKAIETTEERIVALISSLDELSIRTITDIDTREIAEQAVRPALSDRQRQRLSESEAA